MPCPLYTIDAFTDAPFAGNPAAVCLLDSPADERWMQNVAREMNLSETAFLAPLPNGEAGSAAYALRWFTPVIEVPLCGHATLASAHALWSEGHVAPERLLRFQTESGELTARRVPPEEASGEWIELDFPAIEQYAAAVTMELSVALGAQPVSMASSRLYLLCEMKSEQAVRDLAPDFANLALLPGGRGMIVTARAEAPAEECGYDFVSRWFGPALGIDEDPVTGSAHCQLAPYWGTRLGKREMTGYQASQRGGIVRVAVDGDRVKLRGQAVTILRGELLA